MADANTATVPFADIAPLAGLAGLTMDSRNVRPGFLFAALAGNTRDGRDFIPAALEAGAGWVLAESVSDSQTEAIRAAGAELLRDANPRRRLAEMAATFFGPQPARMALVTGTNGKTSTVEFARQLWQALGHKAASIGTLGLTRTEGRFGGALTTPDPISLARMLSELAADGVECVALEASSHGLDQERLSGVAATTGVFTSFGRDHLDYHGTAAAYLDAKLRLFRERLAPGAAAVIYADAKFSKAAMNDARQHGLALWDYGFRADRLRLLAREDTTTGQQLKLAYDGRTWAVELPLVGDFQAYNALATLCIVLAGGNVQPERAISTLEFLKPIDGRLQLAGRRTNGAAVYIDYSHTPAALEGALRALRPLASDRLVVVFGAGGDRDRGKRPEMGAVAARLADHAIVTDDNPRSEDPAQVRAEVLAGCPSAEEIGNRRVAIQVAVAALAAGDVLLIAGKGHETGQAVGIQVLPFNDLAEARAALKKAE